MANIDVKDIAVALYKGNVQTKFGRNEEDANELVRRAIMEAGGCKDGYDYWTFEENKIRVFRLLSEILKETVGETIVNQYEAWVDFKDIAFGDTIEFKVMDESLFTVGYVADGTHEVSRQRLFHGKLAMKSFPMAVKIYEEFDSYRLGRIDFVEMINRVAKSMDADLMKLIVKSVESAYTDLGANYKINATYDDGKLLELIQRTEAKTGKKCAVYGTKIALANLRKSSSANWSEKDKEAVSDNGFVGKFFGTPCVEIPQTLYANSDDFVIDDQLLFIIPEGTKIVKVLFEGDAYVYENTTREARKDMQIEYMFERKVQLGCIKSNVYSVYNITA